MSSKTKLAAIKVTAEVVIAVVLVVILVARFEDEIQKINWRLVALLCGGLVIVAALYRWQMREDNSYDVLDMLMTGGKADLWKHLVLFFAAIAAWTIAQKVLEDPKGDITGLLTIVLGTFVGKEAIGKIAEAIATRPPAPPSPPAPNA